VAVGGSTVYRTKRRFVEGNLERALSEDPRPGAERKLTGISEIAAWEQQRNAASARIKWMFTTEKARAKMGRAYPITSKES
jgi:transposase